MTDYQGGSIWTNSSISQNLEFAVKLRPGPDDWSWNPAAPVIEDSTSYLYLGGPNFSLLRDITLTEEVDSVTILTSEKPNTWEFEV